MKTSDCTYMHEYIYIRVNRSIDASIYIFIHTRIYLLWACVWYISYRFWTHMKIMDCTCMYEYIYVYESGLIYASMHTYTHTHAHAHTHAHTHIHTHTGVHGAREGRRCGVCGRRMRGWGGDDAGVCIVLWWRERRGSTYPLLVCVGQHELVLQVPACADTNTARICI